MCSDKETSAIFFKTNIQSFYKELVLFSLEIFIF